MVKMELVLVTIGAGVGLVTMGTRVGMASIGAGVELVTMGTRVGMVTMGAGVDNNRGLSR